MTFTPSRYQAAIFDWIKAGSGNAVVNAVAGCLAGETILEVNRAGKSYKTNIAHLHQMLEGGKASGKTFDLSIPTRIRSLVDGELIGLAQLAKSVESGYKRLYTITTESGHSVRATADHLFLTPAGWQRLSNLTPGKDSLLVDAGKVYSEHQPKKQYRRTFGLHAHPHQISIGARSGVVALHRVVYEANLNGMSYDEYVNRVRGGNIDGLQFIDPAVYVVHHKDENHLNNTLVNLELMTREEHYRHHANKDGWTYLQPTVKPSEIASIAQYSEMMTYDLTMADGAQPNFLANGIVVHNSGKTTTLEQAAKLLPSGSSAIFIAFNNHIVQELTRRLQGTSMIASTVHSAGRSALAKVRKLQGEPDTKKYRKIVRAMLEGRNLSADYDTVSTITKLADQTRNSLTDPANVEALYHLALRFDLGDEIRDWMLPLVKVALNEGDQMAKNAGIIDFTDMIYLPIRWNLIPAQADIVFGDEIQDWNAAQLELICRMVRQPGGRFLGVGDPCQSIMSFAGADDESFWKIKSRLSASELPLSVCYRCPRSHVALAKEYVPVIEPSETAIQGTISYAKDPDLFQMVKPGDLILCRKTAPLVKNCIALIGAGVAAKVRGRNIGKQLTDLAKTVAKMQNFSVDKFPAFLDQYRQTQVSFLAQKEDSEEQIEALSDRCEALQTSFRRYYAKDASFEAVLAQIEDLFSDDRPAVWLSTIHRAKGLEADRVHILQFDSLPMVWKNQQPYQYAQEENLVYVALTRAKKELIIFGQAPQPELIPVPVVTVKEPEWDLGAGYLPSFNAPWEPFDWQWAPVRSDTEVWCSGQQGFVEEKPKKKVHTLQDRRQFEIACLSINYGKLNQAQKKRLTMLKSSLRTEIAISREQPEFAQIAKLLNIDEAAVESDLVVFYSERQVERAH